MTPRENIRAELEAIAAKHGLTLQAAAGRCRLQPRPQARQEMWALLRGEGWTLPRIAKLFQRDHSTVLSGIKKHLARQALTYTRISALNPQNRRSAGPVLVNKRRNVGNKSAAKLQEAA